MGNFHVTSSTKLFERLAQKQYLEEWTKLLALPQENLEETNESSLVVFRVAKEWFGLSALVFAEIGAQRTINLITYPNDPFILGVVNVQGQLRLCFSLQVLFSLENQAKEDRSEKQATGSHYPRLLILTQGNDLFTFPVEEVESVYQFDLSKMSNVPINIFKTRENYLKGVIRKNEKNIYVINEEMLFLSLRRRML
jgi:chemotaxis-related protein WspD